MGWFGGWFGGVPGAGAAPAAAPGLSVSSVTDTTIVLAHTRPADVTNYVRSRIFYGRSGTAPLSVTTSATESVTLSGLTPGKAYVVYAVAEASGGEQTASSIVLIATTVSSTVAAETSQLATIKEAIKARLVTVDGLVADTIHTRTRALLGVSDEHFRRAFVTGARVNGWEIDLESGLSDWRATNRGWERLDTFVLRGWYGFDDDEPSATTFDDLVEDVIEALNADHKIGATVHTHGTPQIRFYGHQVRGAYLCHHVELALTCRWMHEQPS